MKSLWRLALFLAGLLALAPTFAGSTVRYQLLEGSMLTDECLPCARAPIQYALRGSFTLSVIEENPILSRYAVNDLIFIAGSPGAEYTITGAGTFEFGGEVGLRQQMVLTGNIKSPSQSGEIGFTNVSSAVSRLWPMLAITVQQTNGTLASTITLNIAAAPIREIWFSTTASFHSANFPPSNNEVGAGDILSSEGRIVKTNRQLQEPFVTDPTNSVGLDAFNLLPGGEIAFSTEAASPFGDGSVAFIRSGKVLHFADILRPLAPPITQDPGLDALQFTSDTKFYFSIKQDVIISQDPQNIVLKNGDILWVDLALQQGGVFKSNYELLSRFNLPPSFAPVELGLDALYIWPSGEIWFSTRDGFQDLQLGAITGGDLLSDQGYIVYRNLELVSNFAPIEDVSGFGLDALYVVSDAVATAADTSLSASVTADGRASLSWKSLARVFQVEATDDLTLSFRPISPIVPDLEFTGVAGSTSQKTFYRIRQW
jgi:hypothetical protein